MWRYWFLFYVWLLSDDPDFNPDFIRAKSAAAAGLCAWVKNIVIFYNVFCDVEPKRKALAQANADLASAEDKLAKIKAKIKVFFYSKFLFFCEVSVWIFWEKLGIGKDFKL